MNRIQFPTLNCTPETKTKLFSDLRKTHLDLFMKMNQRQKFPSPKSVFTQCTQIYSWMNCHHHGRHVFLSGFQPEKELGKIPSPNQCPHNLPLGLLSPTQNTSLAFNPQVYKSRKSTAQTSSHTLHQTIGTSVTTTKQLGRVFHIFPWASSQNLNSEKVPNSHVNQTLNGLSPQVWKKKVTRLSFFGKWPFFSKTE